MFRGIVGSSYVFLLFSSLVCSGCNGVPGDDPYALFSTYTDEDGRFSFRYLSPPWKLIDETGANGERIVAIDPNLETIDARVSDGPVNARVKMVVAVSDDGQNPGDAARSVRDEWEENARSVDSIEPFSNVDGDEGVETGAVYDDRRVRAVFFGLGGDEVVSMQVVSREGLDDEDMTLMLMSITPSRTGGRR